MAQLAADVPVVFIQVACFDIVIYFLTNLARTPGQFFINFFVLYLVTMCMFAFFRMLGALTSSLDIATRISGISIQALIVYAVSLETAKKLMEGVYYSKTVDASLVVLGMSSFLRYLTLALVY